MPLRSLFTAVFFVAIGMMLDPFLIIDQWREIALISFAMITGKVVTCSIGLFLSGQNPRTSLRAAFSKSQIGEFSFVIAALGEHLGVTDSRMTAITLPVPQRNGTAQQANRPPMPSLL